MAPVNSIVDSLHETAVVPAGKTHGKTRSLLIAGTCALLACAVAAAGYGLLGRQPVKEVATTSVTATPSAQPRMASAVASPQDWTTLDAFTKQAPAQAQAQAQPDEQQAERARATRQAEIRARLTPPPLPVALVEPVIVKPTKRRPGNTQSNMQPLPTSAAPRDATSAAPASVQQDSVASTRSLETIATIRQLQDAMRQVGLNDKIATGSYKDD